MAKRVGRWKPGQSGNPKGRAAGTGEVTKLRAAIAEHIPEIIAKLVEQAKEGDAQAARLLLERVIPPLKAAEEAVLMQMPEGALTDQGRAVMTAAGTGTLAPGQAAQLLAGLASVARLTETDELAARVAALEQKNGTA